MNRLRAIFRRTQAEQELDEELRGHLERHIQDNIRKGMPPAEARRAALLAFGGLEQIKEDCRDERGVAFLETLLQDLRYALRMLRRSPAFTTAAVLSLALGIGANTAIFTLIHAALLRSLPVERPGELYQVRKWSPRSNNWIESVSYPFYLEMREASADFGQILANSPYDVMVRIGSGGPERVRIDRVTGNYFSMLGVSAELGRTLTPSDEDRSEPAVVLSHRYWDRRFGADRGVVGRRIVIDGSSMTIVGVAARGFGGLDSHLAVDAWYPLTAIKVAMLPRPSANWLRALLRLSPDTDARQAQARLDVLFDQHVRSKYLPSLPNPDAGMLLAQSIHLRHASAGYASLGRQYERPLLVLMAVVALVLLVACANVGNLLLARASAREREIGIRVAVGAGRWRIARQLLTESLVLAAGGGLVGLLLATWGTRGIVHLLPAGRNPLTLDTSPDLAVLAFTLVVSFAAALLFGVLPALRSTRPRGSLPVRAHGTGGAPRLRIGRALVAVQVAVSLLLLIGAGLFVRTLRNLEHVQLGMRADDVYSVRLDQAQGVTEAGFQRAREVAIRLYERLVHNPALTSVSYAAPSLFGWGSWTELIRVENREAAPGSDRETNFFIAGPGLAQTVGLVLIEGRFLGPEDRPQTPRAAVINETLARQYFRGASPIGARFGPDRGGKTLTDPYTIIGVVRDARHGYPRRATPPSVYIADAQMDDPWPPHLVIRTPLRAAEVAALIRPELARIDDDAALGEVISIRAQRDATLAQERLIATLSGFFGLLALLLAAVGLYGLMAYSVNRRRSELGVRLAIGASPQTVRWLVLRDSLVLVGAGTVVGVAAAFAATRFIRALLYGLEPNDPVTTALACLVLVAVSLLAAWLPARRASRVNPIETLRYE
jgi:predicted permease